jgi:DnaJ family protein A protein 5
VFAFYSYWLNFSTEKDFAWADQHNPAAAPNRKTRRLMEDDNKKHRRKERREFVETVRQLAAHVRKKDKRVALFQVCASTYICPYSLLKL